MMMAGPRLSYLFRPRHDRTGDAISAIILLEALFVNINNPVNINIDEPVNGDRYHHCCDGSSAIFFFFEISLSFSTFFIGFRSRRESSNAFFRSYRFTHLSANSLVKKSIRDDINVEMSLLNYVGPGDI